MLFDVQIFKWDIIKCAKNYFKLQEICIFHYSESSGGVGTASNVLVHKKFGKQYKKNFGLLYLNQNLGLA